MPGVERTRGALAAWHGNHMLLPCRAWGHARYGKETGSEADTSAIRTRTAERSETAEGRALTAWHGNQILLPCRAWDAPKSEARRVGREATAKPPAKARARPVRKRDGERSGHVRCPYPRCPHRVAW